jgi:hypothetical protein
MPTGITIAGMDALQRCMDETSILAGYVEIVGESNPSQVWR